jgi:hypothetical protein
MDHKFIKVDTNTIINANMIRWVKKMDECLAICTKTTGCNTFDMISDKHYICKSKNPSGYNKLNQYFNSD